MSTGPLIVCAGGAGPEHLSATLASLGAFPVICATTSPEEDAACAGLAHARRLDPWPGPMEALATLLPDAGEDPVVLLAAGARLRRHALTRAVDAVAGGAGLVVLESTSRRARALRRRLRLYPRAILAPGAAVALSPAAAGRLRVAGWFDQGSALTVADVSRAAGPIRVLARAVGRPRPVPPARLTVSVLIPAYNEEAWIGHTIRSLEEQSRPPDAVVVIDDGSTDRTGAVAAALGARVLRPPSKQGKKATALNYALQRIDTDVVIVLDADTVFHRDAVRHLMDDMEAGVDATCGAVMPLDERGIWARGRAIEYAVAMRVHKRVQRGLGSVFVLSGCIAAYRSEALRSIGGFSERTITDDVDATWSMLTNGYKVGYTPAAMCYTVEPPTWHLYKAQMRRWAGALFQTLPHHVRRLHKKPSLALIIAAALWDAVSVPLFLLATIAMLATGHVRASGLIGIWSIGALAIAFVAAASVMGVRRTLRAFPASLLLLWTNLYFFLEALGREWILRRRSLTWVKGH